MACDPEEIYHYPVPPCYGDTFFAYAYDASQYPLTAGNNYFGLQIPVLDGDFVNRFVTGFETMGVGFQLYDSLIRQSFSNFALLGSGYNPTGLVVLPERAFPVTNAIRFDVQNAQPVILATVGGTAVYASQLIFFGVRRRALHYSDPEQSEFPYYEKQYELGLQNSPLATYQLTINQYATTAGGVFNPPQTGQIRIQDFDFELRRIELQLQSPQQTSQFKIMLYDNYGNQTSNIPLLANKFFHLNPTQSSGELNFQPCPPILYKVNSYLKFDIYSLLNSPTSLPQTFNLLFHGVRRIPCN
jgi:hypothetical protein